MGIQLFEHNQAAYEAAVVMMDERGKAAVIHPTGTGKSFIAFKLAEDHPDSGIFWLSPSEYIYRTQLENLNRTLPEGECISFSNIQFMSYSRLMKSGGGTQGFRPDYIVLDEFHRCGAAEWGKSVEQLLATYPKAKLLGLSATNIRYLDNRRDMAQEIFEGNIASEMTLGDAIARGILRAPKYVVSLYSWKRKSSNGRKGLNGREASQGKEIPGGKADSKSREVLEDKEIPKGKEHSNGREFPFEREMERLERRVEASGNQETASAGRQLLEQLRRALEQADGPDKVFQKHMRKRYGKYIVFCADKEHMDDMKEHVEEWFHLVDESPHVYSVYYNNPETSKEFAAFKEDDGEHLKLLFCIDMLNEGVHVENVDGVILLRPTVSPIIYLQQVGRSLSAGNSDEPVIFDMVNNFEGLSCIDYLEQEVGEAFAMMPCSAGEGKKFHGRFRIIDEVRDCRRLFRQLQGNLASSWENCYKAAESYYRAKGDLRVPRSYVTPAGLSLGSWVKTQRRVYAGKIPGDLTPEKIERLESIGMEWSLKDSSWERGYGELLIYREKYGNLDIKAKYVSESGYALGRWVSNLRTSVRKKGIAGALTAEQQEKLEKLGMIWDKNGEKWETYLRAASAYHETHGNLKIPAKYVTEDGIPLGSWLHAIKHGMSGDKPRAETLSAEQIEQLNRLGIDWERENVRLWEMKFSLAKDYYESHGNLNVPVSYCVDGVKLGRWISNIRVKRKNPGSSGMVLDEERIRQLDSIGMDWKV